METTDFTLPTHQHMQGEEHLLILGGEQENKEKEKKREKDEEEKKNNDLIDFSFNMSSSPREDPSSSSSSSSPYLSSHIIRQRDAEDEREEGKEKEESLHLSSSSFSSNRGIDEGDIAKKYLQERTPRGREEIEEEEKRGLSQDLHNPSSPLQSVTYSSSAFSSSPPPLHDSQREEEREERESNGNLHPISSSAIVPPHVPPSSSATSSSVFVSVPNSSSSSSSSSPRLSSSLVTIEGSPPHTHGGEEARKRKEERRGREENEGKSLLDLSNSLVTSTESTSTSENAISPHISTSQTSSSSPPLPPTSSSPPPSSLPPLPSSSPPPPPSSPPSSSSPPPPPLPSSSSPLPPFNSQHPPFKVNDHSDTSFPTFPRRGEEEEKKRLAVTPSPTATTTTRATTLGFVDSPSATEVRSLPNGTMGTSQEKEREGEGGTRRREEEVAGREEGKEPGVHKKAEHHSVPSTSIATNSSSSPPSVGAKKTTYKKRGEAVESWIRVWKELSEKALFSLEIDQAKKNAVKARKKLAADTKEIRRLFAVVVGAACLQAGGKVSSHASDGSAMPDGSGVEGREKLKSATDTLLRDYQNEIDTLTRRAKTAEAQFLSLVQVLLQQPDLPGLLLGLQRDAAVEEEEEGEKRKRGGEYSEERKEDSISKTDQKKTSSETAIMVSRLQKELHALQCRYEHCETQRIEVTRIADLLKDEIRRFQEMEKEKDFFLSEANKEIDRLAREYEDNLVKKDKEIDQLKEQIEDLEKEFNGLTNQAVTLRKLEEEHVHLKQTFDSKLHLLIQQKEKELLQKSAMKDHEQERLSAFLKQRVDMLEEKNLFLEGKVAEGQQQLVKLKTESEKKCSALTAEINSLLLSAAGQQSMRSQAEAPSIGWKEGKGEGQGEGQEVSSTSSSSHPSLLPSPHLLSSQHTAAVHLRALEVAQERIAALQEEQRRLYRQLEDGRKLREKEAERRETDLRDQESRYNAQLKELQDALSQCPTHEQYANLQREISRLQEVCRSSSSQNKQLSGHPPEVYIHANEAMQQNLYRHADANPSSLHTPSSKEEGGEGSSSSSSSSQLFYLQEEIRQLQYRIDEQEKEMQERERKLQKELEEEKSRHEEEVISIVKRVKEEMRKTSLQKESAIVRKEEEEATMNGVTGEEKNKMGEQGDDQLGDRTILSSFRDRSSDEGYKSKEQEDSRQNASSFSSSSPSILDLVLAQRERYKAKISQLEEEVDSLKARVRYQQCRVEVLTTSTSSPSSSTHRRHLIRGETGLLPSFSSSSMLHAIEQEEEKAAKRSRRGVIVIPPSSSSGSYYPPPPQQQQQDIFELEEGDYHQKALADGSYHSSDNSSGNALTGVYAGEEEQERKRKRDLPSRFVRGLLAVADGMAHAASHTAKSVMWEGIGGGGGGKKRGGRTGRRESMRRSKKNKTRTATTSTKKRSEKTTTHGHPSGSMLVFSRGRVTLTHSEKDGADGEKLRIIEEGNTKMLATTSYDQEACTFGEQGETYEDEEDEELSSFSSSSSSSSIEEEEELQHNEVALHGGGGLQALSRGEGNLLSSSSSSTFACDSSLSSKRSPCRGSPSPYLMDDFYGPQPYHRGKMYSSSGASSSSSCASSLSLLEERRREKAFLTRLRDLSIAERIVIIWGRMLLSCRATRLFALFYFFLLHLLVFFVLFHHADLASRSSSYHHTSATPSYSLPFPPYHYHQTGEESLSSSEGGRKETSHLVSRRPPTAAVSSNGTAPARGSPSPMKNTNGEAPPSHYHYYLNE